MMMIQFTMQCKIMAMLTTQLTCWPRYDNCYPRIDGTTNIGGTYIDFQASTQLQSFKFHIYLDKRVQKESQIYMEPIVLSWSRWIFRLLQSIIPVCGRYVWPPHKIVNSVFDYCPLGFQLFINQQLKTPLQLKWSLEIHIDNMQNMK